MYFAVAQVTASCPVGRHIRFDLLPTVPVRYSLPASANGTESPSPLLSCLSPHWHGTLSVNQADLTEIHLLQLPECWDSGCASPHLALPLLFLVKVLNLPTALAPSAALSKHQLAGQCAGLVQKDKGRRTECLQLRVGTYRLLR